MFYTYILKSVKTNQYYVGCTNNLVSRLDRHNEGYVRSTKAFRPWTIVYKEEFINLKEARIRESKIKSWKKRNAIEKLIHRGPFV